MKSVKELANTVENAAGAIVKAGENTVKQNLVFKVKGDVNVNPASPNHDLYLHSLAVTAKRMVPTYFNCDSKTNRTADPHKIGIMGCRTRVVSNLYGEESGLNRGNVACVTINLVQLAFLAKKDSADFLERLDKALKQSKEALLARYNCLADKADFSELRKKHIYRDSEKNDNYAMLGNGTLSIGFIGLWDAISVLHGKNWNTIEDMCAYKDEAYRIVKNMLQRISHFN